MRQMAIPRCRSRELGTAVWAVSLGRGARLLALVAKEIAKGGELAAVAPVVPALGLGPRRRRRRRRRAAALALIGRAYGRRRLAGEQRRVGVGG